MQRSTEKQEMTNRQEAHQMTTKGIVTVQFIFFMLHWPNYNYHINQSLKSRHNERRDSRRYTGCEKPAQS